LAVTGPRAHWEGLQARAAARGWQLSPAGLHTAQGQPLPAGDEAQVYAALDLPWIPPCARGWPLPLDDPAAWERALADLLPWDAPRQAALHTHTTWSDGHLSVRALAQEALARGIRVLAITDHSPSLKVARGLSADDLARQRAEIQAAQADVGSGLRLLQGAEVDILPDGRLDYPDEVLERLDVVIASPHQALNQSPAEATARLLRAVAHPRVHILGHPTGRMIPRRAGLAPDMARLVQAAARHRVALEINANPHRLDLGAAHARLALDAGAWLSINTDAHRGAELDYWPYGLAVARRAGASAARILNLWEPERLLQYLAQKGRP
ncbi:MAG: PHP domain-containing protein, partial [Chloroflexi bacterium]|nr:PHP domain-containing protein [Chloroflexota bacterium]